MLLNDVHGVTQSDGAAVGRPAPDFELPALISGVRQPLHLSSYRGQKSVALAFYPFNWQASSAAQLVSYQVQRPRFLASNAEVIAITVDSVMNTTAWEREIGPFDFPICSDFWPHGGVCERYRLLCKPDAQVDANRQPDATRIVGASERAVVIVNREGTVIFRKVYRPDEIAPVDEVLAVVESI